MRLDADSAPEAFLPSWPDTVNEVRRAELLNAAAQVASQANSILDLAHLYTATVHLITTYFPTFYHAAVFQVDRHKHITELRAVSSVEGQKMLQHQHHLAIGPGSIIGMVAQTGQPHLSPDVRLDPIFLPNPNLPDTQAEMAFPLRSWRGVIGVLDVQSRQTVHLSEPDIATLQAMADQLANALHNAQLYDQVSRRANALQALFEASQAVSSSLDTQAIRKTIVEHAWKLTDTTSHTAQYCALALAEGRTLRFVATFPESHRQTIDNLIGAIDLGGKGRVGITGRTFLSGQPQMVNDVTQDPDYITLDATIRANLAVPIKIQEQIQGVIIVEHTQPYAFDKEDEEALVSLAYQAGVALHNARLHEELQQSNKLVEARTTLAYINMDSGTRAHAIRKHALTIRDQVRLLRGDLQTDLSEGGIERLRQRLDVIDRQVVQMLDKPTIPPLTSETGNVAIYVNEWVEERARQLWQNEAFQIATLEFDLRLPPETTIQASPEWLRRAFDILVDNAINALRSRPRRHIIISTLSHNLEVEIGVTDTGPGLPDEIKERVGLVYMNRPQETGGLGMGLIMAQLIAQAYGGRIRVSDTGPEGTTMKICLPLPPGQRHE